MRGKTNFNIIHRLYASIFRPVSSHGREKQMYLPQAENDTVFAVIYEKSDVALCVIAVLLFAAFLWYRLCKNKDKR